MTLPTIASCQQIAIEKLDDENVIIEGIAGSGKTSTLFYIAKRYRLRVLFLTYSDELRRVAWNRCQSLGIENVDTFTYRSFTKRYLNGELINGPVNHELMSRSFDGMRRLWDIIVLDEVQDFDPAIYWLVMKLFEAHGERAYRVCVIGDTSQSVYGETGPKFMNLAHVLFAMTTVPWVRIVYNYSFRLTSEMCKWLNTEILREDRLCSTTSDGIDVENAWLRYAEWAKVSDFVCMSLGQSLQPSDIMVTYDDRSRNNVALESVIVYIRRTIKMFVSTHSLVGDVTIAPFRRLKGLEAKIVIVVGFDSSSNRRWRHAREQLSCPNPWYVGLTRASKKLLLISFLPNEQWQENLPVLPFVSGFAPQNLLSRSDDCPGNVVDVHRLVSGLREELVSKFKKMMTVGASYTNMPAIELPTTNRQVIGDRRLSVSCDRLTAYLVLIEHCMKVMGCSFDSYRYDWKLGQKLEWIYMLVQRQVSEDYIELTSFDWLAGKTRELWQCINRMRNLGLKHSRMIDIFKPLAYSHTVCNITVRDLIHITETDTTGVASLWLVIMTNGIEDVHYMQAIMYAYMHYKENSYVPVVQIYSPLHDKQWTINPMEVNDLTLCAETIMSLYVKVTETTDKAFIDALYGS